MLAQDVASLAVLRVRRQQRPRHARRCPIASVCVSDRRALLSQTLFRSTAGRDAGRTTDRGQDNAGRGRRCCPLLTVPHMSIELEHATTESCNCPTELGLCQFRFQKNRNSNSLAYFGTLGRNRFLLQKELVPGGIDSSWGIDSF